jgi:glyoxylase-like metal-dependent hydrolase (beta-lactamase superfamily II)
MQQWQIGEVRITSIVELEGASPGTYAIPSAVPEAVLRHEWLQPNFVDANGNLVMRVQMLVVESQGRRIGIDTCIGNDKERANPFFHRLQLPFLSSLESAGFARDSIDTVICTHLHVDHIGWNTMLVDGRWVPTFPNARYLFGSREWEHWSTYGMHEDGDLFGDSVQPVIDAGLADLVELGHEVTSEVVLEPTPGHTPGHQSVHITSGGGEALITGDALHHPVQCAEPGWPSSFDSDEALAAQTRRDLLARYADTDVLVIGTHFGGPGAGHVISDGETWRFNAAR